MAGVLIRKGEVGHTQGEHHGKMKAETGVIVLLIQLTTETRRGMSRFSP